MLVQWEFYIWSTNRSVLSKVKWGGVLWSRNQCISLFEPRSAELYSIQYCDKVCQSLAAGRWFSAGTPVSSTNKNGQSRYTLNIVESGVMHYTPQSLWCNGKWVRYFCHTEFLFNRMSRIPLVKRYVWYQLTIYTSNDHC
jgi:hypothetical protein